MIEPAEALARAAAVGVSRIVQVGTDVESSRWAVEAAPGRELDYQIWCGPAMGAFNAWARGTYLESPENRRVADIARVLMWEAAYLHRVQQLRLGGLAEDLISDGAA